MLRFGCETVNQCWTGVLRKLIGPLSQFASHASGDMDVWLCLCVSGDQAHGVQKLAGSWQVSLLDPRERCNRFTKVEIKGKASEHCASEPSTAGHSRMPTNEQHMSKPSTTHWTSSSDGTRGCGHHLTYHACCHDMVLHVAVQTQAAVIQVERQAFSQRSEWSFAPKSW